MDNVLPLKALQAFESAGRTGSFQRAAGELGVTPSAISHQIKSLEEYLGFELFERKARKVVLTPLGDAYLETVAQSFLQLDVATSRLQQGYATGKLTVAMPALLLQQYVMPKLFYFTEKHPELEIELISADQESDYDGADVAIRLAQDSRKDNDFLLSRSAELTAVCAPELLEREFIMAAPQLLQCRLLYCHDGLDYWRRWFNIQGIDFFPAQGSMNFSTETAVLQAALEGVGVALIDLRFVQSELAQGLLMAPVDISLHLPQNYSVTFSRAAQLKPAVDEFYRWLKAF